MPGSRLDRDTATDGTDPVAHVDEACAQLASALHLEAGSVIGNLEEQPAGLLPHPYRGAGLLARVLAGILECLQTAEVDSGFHLWRVSAHVVGLNGGGERSAGCGGRQR